ncbi:peptidoglycan recognition protein 6 [Pseudorasbora parva]|uniref:peptidoglycan recognition protein 6 n=1 Tax=Pseudorasbora parva TaxID=51549 RepID=UPI00351DF460
MAWHLGLLVSLLVAFASPFTEATTTRRMDDFISAVKRIEAENPGLQMLDVVKGLRKAAGFETELIKRHLGDLNDAPDLARDPSVISYLSKVIIHGISQLGEEEGVVLTLDGSNVALAPMLLGLEAGLQRTIQGLYPLSLTENLVASLVHHAHNEQSSAPLGTKGFWDSIQSPKVYTLSGLPSLATDALITGGMDGFILGLAVATSDLREVPLSDLLKSYYSHQLDAAGLDAAPRLISQNRRMTFKKFVSFSLLKSQVVQAITVRHNLHESEKKRLDDVVNKGFEEFVHVYAVCPNIITRSQWGAASFIGSPSYLSLPVPYLFIHHTYQPSKPCTTFEQCASEMRSMQRYHQQTNGWSDIGYSFVAGSDGNLYEGRGWNWVGAHTYGYNSKGYGVSFIGDYTSTLPAGSARNMVRYDFTSCAVNGGRLSSSYSLYGHRQATSTDCPGNAFYREIQTWERYQSYLP